MRELALRSVLRDFEPGAVLWARGDTPRGLVILLEGGVRVVGSMDGRPYVVHTEGPGGVLGDVPLFAGGAYPATAIAERRATCLFIGRDAIAAAIRHDPELAFRLLARLASRVRLLISRLDALTGRSVKARLAAFLLERAATAAPDGSFSIGCTQAALAEELGTVREVVVRALRELRRAHVIGGVGSTRLRLLEPETLRALSES